MTSDLINIGLPLNGSCKWLPPQPPQHCMFNSLPAALRAAHSAGISVTQGTILRLFVFAPTGVKFGVKESTNFHAKFHSSRRRVGAMGPPKLKICTQMSGYKLWGVSPWRVFSGMW